MGVGSSKTAAQAARKFPARASQATMSAAPRSISASEMPPRAQASFTKDEAIKSDAIDPDQSEFMNQAFSNRLREMGVAQPSPTFSLSSTVAAAQEAAVPGPDFSPSANNTTLNALQARERIEREAMRDLESMGRASHAGREYVSVSMMRDIIKMRDSGAPAADIERRFNIQPAILKRLGPPGVISHLEL